MAFILQWVDLVWPPLAWVFVHKNQRWWALACILSCMVMMRLIIELMGSIGYSNGILQLLPLSAQARGVGVYSLFYLAYLLYAHYSKQKDHMLFMAASLSVFFFAAITLALAMML